MHVGTPVVAVTISPDNRYLATVINTPSTNSGPKQSKPYTLELREFRTHAFVNSVPFGENGLGPRVVFSPDGKQVGASEIESQEFFEVPSLKSQGSGGRGALVYAPDASWMVYMKGQRIIQRVSLAAPENVLVTNVPGLQELALSPDRRTLASSSEFGDVSLWDARTGRQLAGPLSAHTQRVVSLAFLPDGQQLVSAAWDGLLNIWSVGQARNLGRAVALRAHNNSISRTVVCPDGGKLPPAATTAPCGSGTRFCGKKLRSSMHTPTSSPTFLFQATASGSPALPSRHGASLARPAGGERRPRDERALKHLRCRLCRSCNPSPKG